MHISGEHWTSNYRQFLKFCYVTDIEPIQVTLDDLIAYSHILFIDGYNHKYVKAALCGIRNGLKWDGNA